MVILLLGKYIFLVVVLHRFPVIHILLFNKVITTMVIGPLDDPA